jgi:hypothetical protein
MFNLLKESTALFNMPLSRVTSFGLADGTSVRVINEVEPITSYGRHFMTVFTEEMAHIARTLKHGSTLRVLLLLPLHLSFTEFRKMNQRNIAEELEMSLGGVSEAMKQLTHVGALERQGSGPVTTWKLSPDWGWNGRAGAWMGTQRKRGRNPRAPVQLQTRPGFTAPIAAEDIERKAGATPQKKPPQRTLRLLTPLPTPTPPDAA